MFNYSVYGMSNTSDFSVYTTPSSIVTNDYYVSDCNCLVVEGKY